MEESEKKDKFIDLASELEKLWNMKMTIIPIVIGDFGTVINGLLKGLEDLEIRERVETIQTIKLLRTAKLLRRPLGTCGDVVSLKFQFAQLAGAVEYTDFTSAEGQYSANECPGYDTKQSDGKVPAVLELWRIRSTRSLPSLPGLLWPGVVAPDRALSLG